MFANQTPTPSQADPVYTIPHFSTQEASGFSMVIWARSTWLPACRLMENECTDINGELSNLFFHPYGSTPAQIQAFEALIPALPAHLPAIGNNDPQTAAALAINASNTLIQERRRADIMRKHQIMSRIKLTIIQSLTEDIVNYLFAGGPDTRRTATPNSLKRDVLEYLGHPQHTDYAQLEHLAKQPVAAGTRAALMTLISRHHTLHYIHIALAPPMTERAKVSALLDAITTSGAATTFTTALTLFNNNHPLLDNQTFDLLVAALKSTAFPPIITPDAAANAYAYANAAPRDQHAQGRNNAGPANPPANSDLNP